MADKQHPLKDPLASVVSLNMKTNKSPEEIAEALLGFLGEAGVIQYAPSGSLKFLTPVGRVLVALMERPDMTMRELSLYLGITEAGVMKYVLALVRANVIARTKVKGRNQYRLNLDEALKAPDIARLYAATQKVITEAQKKADDIHPSDDPDAA